MGEVDTDVIALAVAFHGGHFRRQKLRMTLVTAKTTPSRATFRRSYLSPTILSPSYPDDFNPAVFSSFNTVFWTIRYPLGA